MGVHIARAAERSIPVLEDYKRSGLCAEAECGRGTNCLAPTLVEDEITMLTLRRE